MTNSTDNRRAFDSYYESFLGGRAFRWLDFAKYRIIKKTIAHYTKNLWILDLGCGSSSISSKLAKKCSNLEILGADHDPRLLERTRAQGIKTQVADFNSPLPFENDFFDIVLMIDTLEHVESRMNTIAEIKRILAPSGTIIIFTPPYDTLIWLIGEKFHNFVTRRRSEHISPFTRESLAWLLKKNFLDWHVGLTNFGLTMFGIGRSKK